MDWNGGFRPFVSRPPESSFNFLSNYNFDQYPDMKNEAMGAEETQGLFRETGKMSNYGGVERKKRLTSDQLDSLERSFQEEIKLDPDRKIKLSQELGMQPRQIAVWFQNRRARWKAKQLERLYDALKEDYVTISKEKVKLQEEVSELKTMLIEQAGKKRPPAIFTDVSGEETVESTSVAIGGSKMQRETTANGHRPVDCNYLYNVEDYTRVSQPPFWPPGAFCHPILDKTSGEEAA